MADTALTTIPTTLARPGVFHGYRARAAILSEARQSHSLWCGLYDAGTHPYWKAKRAAGAARPSYFGSLRKTVAQELANARHAQVCRIFTAQAAQPLSRADALRRELHCLDIADRHTDANRAEAARIASELARLAA